MRLSCGNSGEPEISRCLFSLPRDPCDGLFSEQRTSFEAVKCVPRIRQFGGGFNKNSRLRAEGVRRSSLGRINAILSAS